MKMLHEHEDPLLPRCIQLFFSLETSVASLDASITLPLPPYFEYRVEQKIQPSFEVELRIDSLY